MANQVDISHELLTYVRNISLREDPVLRSLREATLGLPLGEAMLLMPEEGQLLALLTQLTGATRVIDVGTFTGYSALWLARAIPADGRVFTCDNSKRWLAVAEQHWRLAGVRDRIEARIGDARDTLAGLRDEFGENSFDLVFVDADKTGYVDYYEAALRLLRPGGLVVVDNTLLRGRVLEAGHDDPDTAGVRAFNDLIHGDTRVDIAMLSMADGITLARKKEQAVR
ncbi:class I SAM-dependent methyltransferase [Nocardia sp. CDC159]|uniref:Class I SAM-dependent methyltransferase n=1 Tax=Nocardia pulmonis TaxID=2951408 RepID=A0A9X2EIZ9_9NOCA|nr:MULTISPECIES: class I SAM-dependent methyltransferase [Nocardia]MCM6779026.1 class I SAM-dependent methyltransferase [Nocardia pulmonis]MCM6791916.1 class I SAM-dependent methyltransferase [Nocardia sp. CDC159]